jgi:hypothetical protein
MCRLILNNKKKLFSTGVYLDVSLVGCLMNMAAVEAILHLGV